MTAMPIVPNDPPDAKPCRSVSPEFVAELNGMPCQKPRGHKSHWHWSPLAKRRWEGGINTAPRWEFIDDGYHSEGEYAAMRQAGVHW